MANSYYFLEKDDPRLKLSVENRVRNVFVTQLEQTRHEDNVNYIPVITEAPSRVTETGVHTLQKTLVLKRQVEMDKVDRELALKQQEFKSQMHILAQSRAELERKQQETREKAKEFEKFVGDSEVKRGRAMKKYQAARQQKILKQQEIEDLQAQLHNLQVRQQELTARVAKYKIYEDYLMKILDYFPQNYLDYRSDSLVMAIIQRHETLSVTRQDLLLRVLQLTQELEQGQRKLQLQKQEHDTNQLMNNKELSELQGQRDKLKEQNKQKEMNLMTHQDHFRDQMEEVGSLLIAIKNLGQQCHLQSYGSLEDIDMLTMMDMVKEYILDKTDTEKKAIKLMEYGSVVTSGADLAAKPGGSPKHINNKTMLTSASKISEKTGTS